MANIFLTNQYKDIETALLLEKAHQLDIDKAVAYTDGDRIFINTDDNLSKILPNYCPEMLKWLLWHEEMHMELRHHYRFYKYLDELKEKDTIDKFQVTKDEINIIMDILVHDSMSKMFPELVAIAKSNLAQFRNRNSLDYTFKTNTLEEMLDEYKDHKKAKEEQGTSTMGGSDTDTKDKDTDEGKKGGVKSTDEPAGKSKPTKTSETSKEDEQNSKETPPITSNTEGSGEQEPADWSKLKDRDSSEFITKDTGDKYIDSILKLKRAKARLGKLTETLNGLSTTTRKRTYAMPSIIQMQDGILLKGSKPGKSKLWLCFDATGSMGSSLLTFKDIISKSIPQVMITPTTWFSGAFAKIEPTPNSDFAYDDYYKGVFKDLMPVEAESGYNDDGDRTIWLCYEAEQLGYTVIGVTDGGFEDGVCHKETLPKVKALKHTILVGTCETWLKAMKKINPSIEIILI